jgi:hypothetical protein
MTRTSILSAILVLCLSTLPASRACAQPEKTTCFDSRWSTESIKDKIDLTGDWNLRVHIFQSADGPRHSFTDDFFFHNLTLAQDERGVITGKMISNRNEEYSVCGEVWTRTSLDSQYSGVRLHFTRGNYHAIDILRPSPHPHPVGEAPQMWIGYFLDSTSQMGMIELVRAAESE